LSTFSKMFVPCTPTEALSALKNCMKYLLNDHSRLGTHLLTFHKCSYECISNYQYGEVSASACSKNIMLCSLFFSCKQSFWKYCRSRLGILKQILKIIKMCLMCSDLKENVLLYTDIFVCVAVFSCVDGFQVCYTSLMNLWAK